MATNYTTKTAALKATTADIRKVTAKQVFVDHTVEKDGETVIESANVIDLINNAGLTVGSDPDGDYTADTTVKTNKVNFLGAYVNVVTDESGNTNVYIGENTNAPGYSSITDTLAAANIVYASSTSAYALPSDASAGSSYARTSKLTDTETVNLNGGTVIGNILKTSTIKVTVTSDKGTTVFETPVLFSQATTTATSKTWTSTDPAGAIAVNATSFKKFTSADAKDGKTPDSVTGVFKVTLDNDKLVGTNGGWYSVSVALGGTTKSTNKVFVWKTASTAPSVGTPAITYKAGTTRQVSGLTYDASGSFTLTVPTIANTQQWVTKDTNRLELTDEVGDVDFSGTIATDTEGMTCQGTSTNETAVYKYTATKSASASVKKVSAGISAQAYGQTGAVAGTKVSSNTCTATTWLWTTTTADTALVAKFHNEQTSGYARKYNTLADIKGTATVAAYDSTKSLATDYTSQLLVQGGKLMYPNSDTTTRYKNCTGTRYYVRPLVFSGSNQITEITVTVGSGMDSNFNNGTTRLYLVKKGTSTVQVLNYYKELSSQPYGVGIAKSSAPSRGSWGCTINALGAWALYGSSHASAEDYYLVVEMTESAGAIGSITISQ